MKTLRLLICICGASLLCYGAQAQVSLGSPFTDHMVLQQKTNASIWGGGSSGETLRMVGSWNLKDTISVTVNSSGRWETKIKTPKAGGPYTLKIWGSSVVELQDVLIGEVWLCSGQSNMEWSMNHFSNLPSKEQEIADANHPRLRIFHVTKQGANTLQDRCEAQWTECNSETMRRTSAVGYFFARELMQKMNVPVGIIVSAWGGTRAEPWIPKDTIDAYAELSGNSVKSEPWWPDAAGVLYNQMIHPIAPYTLSGAIWYQGESNVPYADNYAMLMEKLISSWRSAFESEFPFYLVQIAPFTYNQPYHLGAAALREQQEIATQSVPNAGMVVISDLVDNVADIHPTNKIDVGIRLANMAMAKTYDMPIKSYQSPTYKSVEFKGSKAYVSFNDVVTDLEVRGEEAIGFSVAGADGVFVSATATVKEGVVIVHAKEIREPKAVRFCFDNATIGNVFTVEGLPVAPFRTDSKTALRIK